MTLILHAGAKPVEYPALRDLPIPAATPTHVPIPHHRLVDLVRSTLGMYGHEVTDEAYGVTEDGARFFGLLSLKSRYGDYTDTCGLRNSHDKRFPVGIAFGSKVFVCDNLAFHATHVIRTKHTSNLKTRLPGLVTELIEPLADQREAQQKKYDLYKRTFFDSRIADHAIMEMYRKGIIGVQKIADVHQAWANPPHDWGDKTAWRCFNATTFALKDRAVENPNLTRQVGEIIDGTCELVA